MSYSVLNKKNKHRILLGFGVLFIARTLNYWRDGRVDITYRLCRGSRLSMINIFLKNSHYQLYSPFTSISKGGGAVKHL